MYFLLTGSIFTASMMTDVTIHSTVPSAVEKEEEQIDATQPNDHPILKVHWDSGCMCTNHWLHV